ncbi:hypothetical protein ACEPAH_9185 [Sanghuangporus vaninii]
MLLSLLSAAVLAQLSLAAIHEISVGGLKPDGTPNLAFYPNNIKAENDDIVRFKFNVKNHTATQSSFDEPCAKLKNAYGQVIGFDSGFMPVSDPYGFLPTFEVTVNSTDPVWVYCRQVNPPNPTHCQSGMVMAINAQDEGKTFDKFLTNAKASKAQDTTTSAYVAYSSTSSSWVSGNTETVTVTETITETTTVEESWTSSAYWPDAPASTWAANPATHTITVGGKDAGFVYSPSNITAQLGEKVTFIFMQKNHTVTQSSFNDPCRKISETSYPPVYGFDSGFMPVADNATYFPNFTITVNDTNPIWVFCQQQAANFSHCGVGMVAAINANPFSDKSFAAFQQLAVTKNGTGFVNQFGNLTAPPAPSYTDYPGTYGSSSGKSVQNLNALADTDTDSSSADKITTLVNTYAPAALGLLAGAIALLIALIAIGVALLRRIKRNEGPRHFMPSTSYQTVPLTVPHFTEMKDGAHEYEEPRYSDRDV